jgi:tetratricopeptide (TPR) repeat protein
MAAGHTFLIVDQSKESQELWKQTLLEAFPESVVEPMLTGEAALEFLAERKFAVVIASWELAPMTCMVFMQKVREIPKNMHTPIVIFAGRMSERDMTLAKEFDIPNVLLAPFDEKKVQNKISELLQAEKDLDQLQRNLRKIETWIMERRVNEALSLVTSCLKKGPHAARAYCLYGDIWMMAGKFDQAEKAYKSALTYDPGETRATSGLGKCYLKMNKFDDAMKLFEELQKRVPGNISRLVMMGNAYLDKGDDSKARKYFDQAREMDAGNAGAAVGLGKIEFSTGNMEEAARLFKESGKGDEIASYYNGMAIALVNNSKCDDAIKLYNDALRVIPKSKKESLLLFNIGLAYKKSDRFSEAVLAFAQSVRANPSYRKALGGMIACAKLAEQRGLSYDKRAADEAIKAHKRFLANEKMAS